ncbi:alpha/beta hydrolase [Flammeovirga sp. MY04]|uniref:alpha/beta fold hydrolase n=1 Tax=Flammeovirga sp. MY04 TaxID=1191459 RepID=UPI00080627FE|nr:alpha/beta hydrolase [Flammeovirga sp. MY04]ANQ50657.1 alpha/beta hydrolase [Flammeovirga sp. MY04]
MLKLTDNGIDAPILVLIHGFCENKSIWDDFIPSLTPYFRVICLDLPGCGENPEIASPSPQLSDFADEIHQTLQDVGVSKYTMIGHSLGGYVTLAYAKKYQTSLNGIGLFHSTAFEDDDAKKEVRIKAADFVRANGARAFVAPMIGNLFAEKRREQHRPTIHQIIAEAEKESVDSIAKISLAMKDRGDSAALLTQLNIPVLFINGKKDGAVPLEKSVEQSHLPNDAHVYYLGDVGHMGMFEEKLKCQQIVMNFLTYTNNR